MKLIAIPYIAANNVIAVLSSRIPDKVRTVLINASVYALLCIGLLKYCNKAMKNAVHFSELLYPVGIAAMVLLIIAGSRKEVSIKKLKLGNAFWFGWILCFAMMFVMAFVNPVTRNYFMWSVTSIFMFPLIFIAWSEKDRFRELCSIVSEAVLVMAYVFIILSLLLVPFFSGGTLGTALPEYIGMAVNPNNNGMLTIAFYGPIFYLLLADRKRKPIYYLVPMGFCISISVISNCRTAELGILLQTAGGLLYHYLSAVRPHKERPEWKKLIAAILIVSAVSLVSGFVLSRFDNMDLEVNAEDSLAAEAFSGDEVFEKLDDISSGRLIITRYYIENSTFWGHGSPDGPVMEGYQASKWSFNNAVDVLYISGVLPFIGCVLWFLAVIVFCIKCIFGGVPRRPEYLFTIVTFAGYFVEFMLEVTIYPITTSLVLLAYIGMIPVACREKEKRKAVR